MKRLIVLAAITSILFGCGSSSKVAEIPPAPSWVQSRPNLPGYYVGIGSARKSTPDYQQAAKQNALADMASDISVTISAKSVLNSFETQEYFSEDFRQSVRAEAQKELEGYEVVSTWEDQNTYWIYFRLSKDKYAKMVAEKKATATAKSLDFYDKAIAAINANDSKTALLMLIRALEPIKPYLNESIAANYNGKDILLSNEIINQITSTINSLIVSGPDELTAKLGHPIKGSELTYTVKNKNGIPQNSIPLKFTFSANSYLSKSSTTNNEGKASFDVEAVRSRKKIETAKVIVDVESIVKEATRDFAISKAISRIKAPTTETRITITRPSFYIASDEKNLNQPLNQTPLADALRSNILKLGFPIADNPNDADFIVNVTANTKPAGRANQYIQVVMNLDVNVQNKEGNLVYTLSNRRIKASHFKAPQAGANAYKDAVEKINSSIVREIITRVIRGDRAY
ncbi:LPP20 family lipoprotein [Tenuifilum thalassicum]|uniref:Lipoprotein LPP20-like domain-containing protein n=1 Tax=Tenuifilum thalassicum TaxID=2590900 RepID=A0A7D4CQ54_9BACT|nr:LPP20 family lipoprotein [Tenuifilum thalassicum]QKG79205.1 hypothetical protein FHG85_02645 [Tenuifilum thalassicum]